HLKRKGEDESVAARNVIVDLGKGIKEVYALVSTHKVAKELWERIQMLMQGTSLSKQEWECKLYDEFDKFMCWKGETLRDFYLRFSLLLDDMNMYNMKLEQFQVNTKMILKSVEQGPLLWPTVEEDRVIRLKKYFELSAAEAIQADCDVKVTNIILQGLH
nr:hypothetical protein [Tanacetum cinerariifolium]